jgi:alkylhydroperoxidase family enzyme
VSRIPDAELPADLQATMRNNLHRMLANNQTMADGFAALARLVHSASHLPHRVRELVILRIASMLKAEVEWAQHFEIAQISCGVSARNHAEDIIIEQIFRSAYFMMVNR